MIIQDGILESKDIFIEENKASLLENYLVEDRMVKYNGEIAPKFGWCVIYVGGPGSGKGSASKFKSRLQGIYFNVDDLKEKSRIWDIVNTETGKPYSDELKTPEYARDIRNSEFVSELHNIMKPLGNKIKNNILDSPENKGKGRDRLPNIIFDITGDKVSKITEIVEALKPVGYKIAIVWMLSTIERALRNNASRPREVSVDNVFIPKHEDVINAMEKLFNSGEIENINEFWVVDTATEINPRVDPVGYHEAQNVYHIPCTPDGLKVFDNIIKRINYNRNELSRLKQKRAEKFK